MSDEKTPLLNSSLYGSSAPPPPSSDTYQPPNFQPPPQQQNSSQQNSSQPQYQQYQQYSSQQQYQQPQQNPQSQQHPQSHSEYYQQQHGQQYGQPPPQQHSVPNPSDQKWPTGDMPPDVARSWESLDTKGSGAEKILKKLVELKKKDIEEQTPGADSNRQDIQDGLLTKYQETDDNLKKMLISQHANASKVFSLPGEKKGDSPIETKFIRNQKGDVIGKEFFVKEYYQKDVLAMSSDVKEESMCLHRRYTLQITGDLVEKGTEVKFDMYNWKLINNRHFLIFLTVILCFSIIAFYMIGSKWGFLGILGFFGAIASIGAGSYWKWYNLEKRMNEAAAVLLRKWTDFFKGFGQIDIPEYKRFDKAVAFIEVVERTMKQRELFGKSFQNEMEGLIKDGFGKTYYRYIIFDNNLVWKQNYNNLEGLVAPAVILFLQLVVLSTGAAFTKF